MGETRHMFCRSTDFLTLRCGMFSTRSGAAFICVDIKVSVTFLGQHTSYKGTLYCTERGNDSWQGSCLCRKLHTLSHEPIGSLPYKIACHYSLPFPRKEVSNPTYLHFLGKSDGMVQGYTLIPI